MKLSLIVFLGGLTSHALAFSASPSANTVVVVSPPGGIGEVAAVKAACMGSKVRWFVVSRSEEEDSVKLASSSLQQIANADGELQLAGATVDELLDGGADSLTAVTSWCGSADSLVCSYDGCDETLTPDGKNLHQAAVRLAVGQASSNNAISGAQVVLLPADLEVAVAMDASDEDGDGEEGIGGLLSNLNPFGQNAAKVPDSLISAVSSKSASVCTLRHGTLFGMPESSPEFSAMVGGMRKDPILSEELAYRTVRMDPYLFRNNLMAQIRTCRQAAGEAAALVATNQLAGPQQPVTVASQLGSDAFTFDRWQAEVERIQEQLASGRTSTLFEQEMQVADTDRLTEWLASKWAPTVLRTYDIAAIRIGARPVYATKSTPNQVEIVWQELMGDMQTATVGKMLLEVTSNGVTATRLGGDATKGYGAVSATPLNGEDVLVRRLAEGAAQAMDKGLAKRIKNKAKSPQPVAAVPAKTVVASGNVESASAAEVAGAKSSGPRSAGARRSTERKRRGS